MGSQDHWADDGPPGLSADELHAWAGEIKAEAIAALADKVDLDDLDAATAARVTDTESATRAALNATYVPRAAEQVGASSAPLVRLVSTGPTGQNTLALQDTADHGHDLLNIEHYGDGTTGPTSQSYAINIANNKGARPALVIHQYSNNGGAVRIDNTDISPSVQIWNTENPSKNPGGTGTGAFFQLRPYGEGTGYLYLLDSLTWLNTSTKNVCVQSTAATAYTFGIDSNQNIPGLYVTKGGTGAGAPIYVTNAGTSPGIDLYQNGTSGLGFRVTTATGHATYAFQIKGQSYGGSFETTQSASNTMALLVDKKGTGAGEGIRIINRGTGHGLSVRDAGLAEVFAITANGLPRWAAAANAQTTVGAAGSATPLPAAPSKYLKVVDSAGVTYVIPAYAA